MRGPISCRASASKIESTPVSGARMVASISTVSRGTPRAMTATPPMNVKGAPSSTSASWKAWRASRKAEGGRSVTSAAWRVAYPRCDARLRPRIHESPGRTATGSRPRGRLRSKRAKSLSTIAGELPAFSPQPGRFPLLPRTSRANAARPPCSGSPLRSSSYDDNLSAVQGETRALVRSELVDRRSFLTSSGLALGATAFSRLSPSEGAMHDLTAAEIARQVRSGTLSPVEVVEACLKRIDEVDPSVLAWVHVDRSGALQSARELEAEAREGKLRGPLHGAPVGIKDIIAVAGMTTTNGSGEFAHERPEADATCVAKLRGAGAVILGKTATTQFASGDPAPTRNPWNLEHTPGGSSSGSAAGVASGMMPLALGTQTGGSVLRPAAYCGIVGLKPTHGRISTGGVTPLAWSLDHVGIFARTVADAALALGVLAGHDDADLLSATAATTDYMAALHDGERPPRLGIPRKLYQDKAIEEVLLPDSAETIRNAHAVVMRVEAAAYHRERFLDHADSYRPFIHAIIEEGLSIPGFEYARARNFQREFRRDMTRALEGLDGLLMPVAPTPAPKGLESTGDPSLCVPGSFSGLPAIALPSGLSAEGLPLAIQLIAGAFAEDRLLSTASWCAAGLPFHHPPPT